MNYYFIDYENVHADGFTGAESLGENDVICVMYTEQSKAFSLELVLYRFQGHGIQSSG